MQTVGAVINKKRNMDVACNLWLYTHILYTVTSKAAVVSIRQIENQVRGRRE